MKTLQPHQYAAVRSIFAPFHLVMIDSILAGLTPGKIFVEDNTLPQTAVIHEAVRHGITGHRLAFMGKKSTLHKNRSKARFSAGSNLPNSLHRFRKGKLMIKILGSTLILRDWQMNDLDYFANWLQPGQKWQQLDGPYYPKTKSTDIPKIIANIRWQIEKADWPHPRQRLIICDKVENLLLGQVSWYWQGEETNWLSIGIVLYDPTSWGKGLGFEALGLWCDYLLHEMPQLARLDLRTWSGNKGMMHLAEKLGFQEEARFRDARIVEGKLYDSIGYGLLRAEWNGRYPQGFLAHLNAQSSQPPDPTKQLAKMSPNEKTAAYQQQITNANPNLAIQSTELNTEGLVNDVLIVNGRHVFRFPKHEWAIDHLWQEANCLTLASQHITIPLSQWSIYKDNQLGIPFVGYEWIPGEALTQDGLLRLPIADQQAIAEQLGTFLHQLHTIPIADVEQAEIRPSVTNRTHEDWQKLYDDVQEKLCPHLMQFARDWVDQHFAPVLNDPKFMAHTAVFMNGDLGGYHLLFNPSTKRLNGIIDFGTAGIGDPAADFACLINQFGETFVRQMTPSYPNIEQLIERARFWAGTLELQWLLGGLRYPDEPDWFMVHVGRARDVLPIGSGW